MKKVLFASTALVLTAGVASAQDGGVSISGFAEIGIFGGDNIEDQFHTDIDATFTMSGATDNGLTFGASIDLDESTSGVAFANDTEGGETIFISGAFGTLTWGSTDGAFDWALQEVAIGGTINDSNTAHAGYSGNSGLDGVYEDQIVRWDYVLGDLAFAISLEQDDGVNGGFGGNGDEAIGLGVRYGVDLGTVDLRAGLGYQTVDTNAGGAGSDVDIFGLSVDARFANGFRAIANYSDLDGFGGRDDHWALGVGYTLDAWTFGANYGSYDNTVGGDDDGFALNVAYDLGGGAVLQAGYSTDDDAAGVDADRYDLGLALSF